MGNAKFRGVEDSSAVCGGDVEVPHDTHCHHDEEETLLPSLTLEPPHFEVIWRDLRPLAKASSFSEVGFISAGCRKVWKSLGSKWIILAQLTGHEEEHAPHRACLPYVLNGTNLLLEVSSSSMEHSGSLGIWLAVVVYIEKTNTEWCGPPWRTDLLWALWSHRDGAWWPVVDMQWHTVDMQEPPHCSQSPLVI